MIAYLQPFLLHAHCHLCVMLPRVSSCQTLLEGMEFRNATSLMFFTQACMSWLVINLLHSFLFPVSAGSLQLPGIFFF